MAASNTPEVVLEKRGRVIVGVLRGMLPLGRRDLAEGTVTILLDDGTGITFNGAFWQETKDDCSGAIECLEQQLQAARKQTADLIAASGARTS